MPAAIDFNVLQTPAGDGQVLLAPAHGSCCALIEQNRTLLARYRFAICDWDVQDLRRATRAALAPGVDADGPMVLTGHQPEFVHAGVWVKHVVTTELARKAGATAVHLVVDNDVPKKPSFTVPRQLEDRVTGVEVPFAQHMPGQAFEQVPALSEAELDAISRQVREAMGPMADASLMDVFIESAKRVEPARDFVDQMMAGREAIDRLFDVAMLDQRVSDVWGGPIVAMMIADAERFAACYNGAISDYRREHGIKGDQRPIPDLVRDGGRIELPIWAYGPGEVRRRLFVHPEGDWVGLYVDDERMGSVGVGELQRSDRAEAALAAACDRPLRPRALTLTLWARMLASDVFVHGIGGAKYDRITDQLIRRYFGVEPPGMVCASATLRLPLPRYDVTVADLAMARFEQRDLRYNPQRYVAVTGRTAELVDQRQEAIACSDRLAASDRRNHGARREAFDRIRRANGQVLGEFDGLADEFAARVERIRAELIRNRLADSREYFVGLFSRDKLGALAEAVRGQFK